MEENRHNAIVENWHKNVMGRVWMNNGIKNKYVKEGELAYLLNNGFSRGRINTNKSKVGKIFLYRLNPWSVIQVDCNAIDLDSYMQQGYKIGLPRSNSYLWFYKDEYFVSAKELALYLEKLGYDNATETFVYKAVLHKYKDDSFLEYAKYIRRESVQKFMTSGVDC